MPPSWRGWFDGHYSSGTRTRTRTDDFPEETWLSRSIDKQDGSWRMIESSRKCEPAAARKRPYRDSNNRKDGSFHAITFLSHGYELLSSLADTRADSNYAKIRIAFRDTITFRKTPNSVPSTLIAGTKIYTISCFSVSSTRISLFQRSVTRIIFN